MTTNIKDYSTTQASNTSLNGIDVDEGMLPSNLNNAIRALMKNTRDFANDSQWFEYGVGSGAYTAAYASATSFTINGADVTSVYHAGRRIKLTAATPGTIFGTISSSSFSTNTTVNVTWDSGSLSSEAISNVYIAALSKTNSSIPTSIIGTSNIVDGSITNAKLGADSVNGSKIADDSINSEHYVDGSIDTQHIANLQVTNAKLGADSVNGSKIADDSIDSEHYVDGSIDTAHLGNAQVSTVKIADNNITTSKILNANVTADKLATDSVVEAKIQNNAVTTNKINNDAVTIDKIADAVIVTNSEHSGHTPDDNTFFTTLAANNRFLNKDTSELISSGQSWTSNDNFIATTAAIDTRVVDLVDDVGGFVPIANQTSFPNTNPDVNNGVGTIVSIQALSQTLTANGSGVVSISNGTVGGSTVTLNNCGANASLPSGFGILVESTTTQHTYNFHRLVPKATEVTAVAAKATEIGRLGTTDAVSDMNTLGTAQTVSDMNTLAAISGLNSLASNSSNVTTVANNLGSVNNFAEVYRISANAPTTSLNSGDLWFDSTNNILKVYGASGFQSAGSSVNGTSERFKYTVSGTPTTISGNDDNGNSLNYDAGFIDVYLNGIKMVNTTDVTVTSGSSIVFASALTNGDIVEAVAFGTFSVASLNADNLSSGTVPDARITGTYTGITGLDLTDNSKIRLGTGNDLEIFHSSSSGNSFIRDVGTGKLLIGSDGTSVEIQKTNGEEMAVFNTDGAVELYYDNAKKFETTSTGATVTGTATVTGGLVVDTDTLFVDSSNNKVGINTNTPGTGLQVNQDWVSNYGSINVSHSTNSLGGLGIRCNNVFKAALIYKGGSTGALLDLGTYETEPIIFRTANSERMRILSDGKVGIGTSSPSANLEVRGASSNGQIYFGGSTTATYGKFYSDNDGTLIASADGGNNASGSSFRVEVDGSEKMRISSDGKVGIKTSSPGSELHIVADDVSQSWSPYDGTVLTIENNDTDGCILQTVGRNTATNEIWFGDDDSRNIGRIRYEHSDDGLEFWTNNSERMRITSAGHVIAPNLNTTGSTSNRYPLYWVHTGTIGSIEPATGSIRAMKTDINDMGSVNWIHSLRPRSFKFRDYETDEDGNKVYLETTNILPNTEYGLIAEEVNEINGSDYILDKQIDENGNENLKGVLYHNLVPVLLKAVQEQKNTIQELEARITTLENN